MTSHVFITRPVPEDGLAVLRRAGVRLSFGQDDPAAGSLGADAVLEGTRHCDVLLPLLTETVDRAVLEVNPRLLGVANYAVGYNNVDVEAATELGIPVSNTPGVLTDTTADFAWALLLAVSRRVVEGHAHIAAGRFGTWDPSLFLGADVSPGGDGRRKVLGVVGFGRIGQAVARRAAAFEMDVLAHDPRHRPEVEASGLARWAELPELLAASDYVSLHVPLRLGTQRDATRHLVGEAELRAMKSTAYLVNTARGPVVDEAALVRALREGWIAGAGLDVFEDEPRLAPGLADLPNAVLCPHIGSASVATRVRMAEMAAENALAHLRGERAPNAVNPEVYETDAYRRRTRESET